MATQVTPLRMDDELTRRRHAEALAALIEGEVRFEKHDRMLYSTDASIYQVEPIGVVIPAHEEDVRRVVAYCAEHGLPILPRGGGTSLAGQCTNQAVVIDVSANLTALGWVVDEMRACGVEPGITIDDLNDQLRADGHGLFFAPDPATARQCNIGGAIGNNAAGTRSIVYGRTSENVEAVRVLLASAESVELARGSAVDDVVARRLADGVIAICARYEGEIRKRFPKTLRRNAGYALDMALADIDEAKAQGKHPHETLNLANVICGSEGTLGIVTYATLKLHAIPKAKGLAVIGFASIDAAIDAVPLLLELKPTAVELLDDMIVGLARGNLECRGYVDLLPQPRESGRALAAVLYVEFFSHSGAEEIAERFEATRKLIEKLAPSAGFAGYTDATAMGNALKLRKAGEPLLHGVPGKRKPLGFVEDNAAPVEHLAQFVREFRAILAKHDTRGAFWAHASVGVLHVRPLLDLRDEADRGHMEQIAVEVADLAQSLGGVMSGEHGDGRVRGPLLERYFGAELMEAFREIKELFDPNYLLNPGNIVPLGEKAAPIASIHESTRVRPHGANLSSTKFETYFDYSAEGGFDHAVELCNGSGVCRKKQGGTMCPSYMATLDERHSTRGRGNALRLAITGQLGEGGVGGKSDSPQRRGGAEEDIGGVGGAKWDDAETMETLRLCLSCKACKSECPTNVDVAQYKAEYLAQSYKAAGAIPLSARVMGQVRLLNRIGSMFAPVSNWVASSWLHRAVVNPLLGLDKRRSLPRFERSLFRELPRQFKEVSREAGALVVGARSDPAVVLFADCFVSYNEPQIGIATIRALVGFGYRVAVVDAGCCGRALISTGQLDEARRTIARTASKLIAAADHFGARGVLVCEPSCLSAVKDEWLKLRLAGAPNAPARERLTKLAAMAHLPEEFLDRQWEEHPKRPAFTHDSRGGVVALHGHCHQKALWGAESSARLLRRVMGGAGDAVKVLDTGCCGMAGSFGYTADRYDLSMQIGELSLFPAARKLGAQDTLIAPGTSCRHQVKDGVHLRAEHPMEFVARCLCE